jgi:phage gp16-like protein
MPINLSQIKLIHTAKNRLKLADEHYREILSSFGVSSSKDLTQEDAKKVIQIFEKLGFKPLFKEPKHAKLKNRENMASPKQLRKIEAMWKNSTRVKEKTDEALRKYIKRIAGVDHINWLTKDNVQKVIKAIENLV